MNREQLKQRIVGAIVLVALGVIFIPMILNRDNGDTGITGSNIPPKPQELSQLSQQPMPGPPAVPAQPAETKTLVDKHTPSLPAASAPPEKPAPAPANTAPVKQQNKSDKASVHMPANTHAWVVQVASFTDRNKALKLRDRLRKAKFTCFVEAVSNKRGTMYRVRVGPVVKRTEADRLKAKITRELKLKGALVMSHP
ncbi:MAG: SPOR domain-containing protein [Gammaproteobacteria bacterium]